MKTTNIFKNKNYVLLFFGQLISNLGTTIYNFAMSIYILRLTDNAAIAGIYMATGGVVFFILTPFAGAIVDRLNKIQVVYVTDFINGCTIIFAGIGIFLSSTIAVTLIILFIATAILSINSALFNPAISSLPPHILEKHQLQQASSVTMLMYSLYGIFGAVFGALAMSLFPIYVIFLINGFSFILSGISEVFIEMESTVKEVVAITFKQVLIDIKEGFIYIKKLKPILYLIIMGAVVNFFSTPVIANGLPYLIEIELNEKPIFLSILNAGFPIGIIITSIILSMKTQKEKVAPLIRIGMVGMTFGFILFVILTRQVIQTNFRFIHYIIISTPLLIFTGVFNGVLNIPFDVAVKTKVEKEKMGRVFSVMSIISHGLTPLSIGIAGFVIEEIGILAILYSSAIAMVVMSIYAIKNKYIGQL